MQKAMLAKDVFQGAAVAFVFIALLLGAMAGAHWWVLERPALKMRDSVKVGMTVEEVRKTLGIFSFTCKPGDINGCPPKELDIVPSRAVSSELIYYVHGQHRVMLYIDSGGRVEHVGMGRKF